MKLRLIWTNFKRVYYNWKYSLFTVLIALMFYLFNVLISSWRIVLENYEALGFLRGLKLFFTLSIGFGYTIKFHSFVSLLIISLLVGVFSSLVVFKTRIGTKLDGKKVGLLGSFAIFLAVLAPGCAVCGIGLISMLGFGAGLLSLLPYEGLELSIISISILIYSIIKLSNDLYVCKNPLILNKNLKGGKKMNKEEHIKKKNLWKYSTFLLIALIVITVFVTLVKNNGSVNIRDVAKAKNQDEQGLLKKISENPDLFPYIGPEDAEITVTEFIDFQCPFCGIASGKVPWGSQYQEKYGDLYGSAQKVKELAEQGKIRYVVGIMSFLGPESVYAAQAGYCANQQGKFFEIEDALYSAQTLGENSGKFNKDKLEIIAQDLGDLDQNKFKDCLENDETLELVQESSNLVSQFVSGTPTFYVNNKKVAASWSSIKSAIGA